MKSTTRVRWAAGTIAAATLTSGLVATVPVAATSHAPPQPTTAAVTEKPRLPKVHYTNRTRVRTRCDIHWNYPHTGVTPQSWPAGPGTSSKIVGVRYTAGGHAMVFDGVRQRTRTAPWWGWIKKKCLVDPFARKFPRVKRPRDLANRPDPDSYARRLPSRHATRGNNSITKVDITPNPRKRKGRVTVGTTGILRNQAKKFATGNVGAGWVFQITRSTCRRPGGRPYQPEQWVFGYSPDARRWGYVQARHLPACTRT